MLILSNLNLVAKNSVNNPLIKFASYNQAIKFQLHTIVRKFEGDSGNLVNLVLNKVSHPQRTRSLNLVLTLSARYSQPFPNN
jgi:hypothetical protein